MEAARQLKPDTILSALTQNLFASAVSSTLTIAFCLSYAALIFSGPLTPWLGYGIAVSFLSAAVGGFVLSLVVAALPAIWPWSLTAAG